MSTREVINECVAAGDLYRITPRLPGSTIMREFFAAPKVFQFLNGQTDIARRDLMKRAADSRAAVDRFIAGAEMSVGMDPYDKSPTSELARNYPPENGIWDFRVRGDRPFVRIFGAFSERDVFVALDYRNRDALDFDAAVATVSLLWDDMFGECQRVTGDDINAYLSDKYTLV